ACCACLSRCTACCFTVPRSIAPETKRCGACGCCGADGRACGVPLCDWEGCWEVGSCGTVMPPILTASRRGLTAPNPPACWDTSGPRPPGPRTAETPNHRCHASP